MTPPIERLLFTALSVFTDPEERRAFLDHSCRDAPDLRKQLDELLAIEGDAVSFFETPPKAQTGEPPDGSKEDGLHAQIDRYRLLTEIGEGGCGVVFYAEQEEPVRRKVALKIIKLGMDTEAVIARFDLERRALEQMDHPNIARVLDAGATGSGRPYFVMEFVDGKKITDFCDASHLNIRQRLDLFAQVCRAIQHAHQKGLIHRDIKPSNVLVHWQDNVAVPKIIDFGIAKATALEPTKGITATRSDQLLGTPSYMSPEQAQGGTDTDTRSDIYSLGVLLYELLCGRQPFDPKRLTESAVDEVRRIIQEEEPKRPSAALKAATPEEGAAIASNRGTDAQRLVAQLAGDLDWIVMKAMEKERSRRYETANGLAMDLLRYLNNEVVSARPPSRSYRFGKLVRRNKLVFVAGSIAAFGLLAGFSISTVMFFRERAAKQEQARLRQTAEFRSLISQAAVRIKYGDFEGADKLLAGVPLEETPSSLEAANTFGAVADRRMKAGWLKEASLAYAAMVRAITSVDNSDLPEISINLLPAAATVTYAGDVQTYEEIRRMAIRRFGHTTNGVVAERTLKACSLLPADEESLHALEPLAGIVERAIESKEGQMGTEPAYTAWGCFAISLWNYRTGDFRKAVQWAEKSLAFPKDNQARIASVLTVRAMIEQKLGQPADARASLAQAREPIQKVFAGNGWLAPHPPVSWFEWLNAALLLTEAERLVGSK